MDGILAASLTREPEPPLLIGGERQRIVEMQASALKTLNERLSDGVYLRICSRSVNPPSLFALVTRRPPSIPCPLLSDYQ